MSKHVIEILIMIHVALGNLFLLMHRQDMEHQINFIFWLPPMEKNTNYHQAGAGHLLNQKCMKK